MQLLQYIKAHNCAIFLLNRRFSGGDYCAAARFFSPKYGPWPGAGPGFYEQLFGLWPGAAAKPEPETRTRCSPMPENPEQFPNHPGAARTPGKKMGRSTRLQPDSPEQFSPSLCPFLLLLPVTGII